MLLTDKTTFTEFLIEARRSHPEARGDLNGVLHSSRDRVQGDLARGRARARSPISSATPTRERARRTCRRSST